MESGYKDFDLDVTRIDWHPVSMDIVLQNLRTNERDRLTANGTPIVEERLEDYLVSALMDYNDIDYDRHAALLYKLAGQVVAKLQAYLPILDDVQNVLLFRRRLAAEIIHEQMQPHYFEHAAKYVSRVSQGVTKLKPVHFTRLESERAHDFRQTVEQKSMVPSMFFTGFRKCLYSMLRFQSTPEKQFAILLEDDTTVKKWLKPVTGQFAIYYRHNHNEQEYIPDFAVETTKHKYLCEVKQMAQLKGAQVAEKAKAAVTWCEAATKHALENGGLPWSYLLIPEDDIQHNMTLDALVKKFECGVSH